MASDSTRVTVTRTTKAGVPSAWDNEADVVVLGSGLAGLSAAITAHDFGASVIVLEKMDQAHEGGNSRVSGNMFWAPDDVAKGAAYIRAMEKGQVEDEGIFSMLAEGLMENLRAIQRLGGTCAEMTHFESPEWPTLPGAETVHTYRLGISEAEVRGGGLLWQLYRDNVTKRGVNVLYCTPVTDLIQSTYGNDILGMRARSERGAISIRANKAVVLACGGFEFDVCMQKQYLPAWPIFGIGCPGNTGDGIRMAQKVGADLWHMNQLTGGAPQAMVIPGYSTSVQIGVPGQSFVYVDKQGNRYMNERGVNRHGWGQREHTLLFSGEEVDFLRIPTWIIFDEATRMKGPLLRQREPISWFVWYSGYAWSKDNSAEVAKGWIVKADSIGDLATRIASDSDNERRMNIATLETTIARYNEYCAAESDSDFGRPATTLAPISGPPFYAVKVWPCTVNTQGGPRRNARCQVVDPDSNPIPRLYAAGECGSFWGWMYNGGGNLGECMLSGRIAGENAAVETPWT